jgi:hypothetical protein
MMSDFVNIHAELRRIMLQAAPHLMVATDNAGDLVVHSNKSDPKTGKAEWFGAVAIKKSYVAYHLFPLYTDPSIGADISPALSKRRQGKSCFNFKTAEAELFEELAALTRKAAAQSA